MTNFVNLLVLLALLALFVRGLEKNHLRSLAGGTGWPGDAPLGSDTSRDRDGERVRADLRASAARPSARVRTLDGARYAHRGDGSHGEHRQRVGVQRAA
jgi:hypothetical protein